MRILGIDPGSRNAGWGVVTLAGSQLHHVASGTIAVHPQLPLEERLRRIGDALDALLAKHIPDSVAVESIFHHRNSQSALKLGHARGVALLCVARAGAPLCEYSPAEIKKATAGNGRAPKEQVQQMVRLLLGYSGELSPDAADALAAAICHAHAAPAQRLIERQVRRR